MINPQMIAEVQQMVQKGAAWKDILLNFKKQGMSPQLVEDILCEAFPQVKQAKQAIANSGLSTRDYLSQLSKQNGIPTQNIDKFYADFNGLLK